MGNNGCGTARFCVYPANGLFCLDYTDPENRTTGSYNLGAGDVVSCICKEMNSLCDSTECVLDIKPKVKAKLGVAAYELECMFREREHLQYAFHD